MLIKRKLPTSLDQSNSLVNMSAQLNTGTFIELTGQRIEAPARKCWLRDDGSLVTVEEFVGTYYVTERHFNDYLVDTACVYGGLLWVLFHDLLFHTNVTSHHPFRRLFYSQPRQGYLRYQETIEDRLAQFATNRPLYLQESFQRFHVHPLFEDPSSRIPQHFGSWARRHERALMNFCLTAPEHGMENLIRECLITSSHGVNRGWPDLVTWDAGRLIFAEVKARDQLSPEQVTWIYHHCNKLTIELVRVNSV